MKQLLYTICDRNTGYFATYGENKFKKDLQFARLYKSKEKALKHYSSRNNNYDNLNLAKVNIEIDEEERLYKEDFEHYKGDD